MAAKKSSESRFREAITIGFTQPRFRWLLWVIAVAGILCASYFGFKNAGSYAGYDAGSILRHSTYVDTWYTETYGDASGMTDTELNNFLGNMRMRNMPGMIVGIALIAGAAGLAFAAGSGYVGNVGQTAFILRASKPSRELFQALYDADGQYRKENGSTDADALAVYALLAMCTPAADQGFPGEAVDAEAVRETRKDLDAPVSKVWLALMGYKLDEAHHLCSLVPAVDVPLPHPPVEVLKPAEPPHAQEPVAAAQESAAEQESAPAAPSPSELASMPNANASQEQGRQTGVAAGDGEDAPAVNPPVRPFCPKCGTRLPDDARFCPRCGTPRDVYQ